MDAKAKRGRPAKADAKVAVSLRLPPDVVAGYQALGTDWRARMEAALVAGLEPATPIRIAKPDIKAAHGRVQKRYPKTLAALAERPEEPAVAPKIVLQVGPAPTAYGSRLKTPKTPKR